MKMKKSNSQKKGLQTQAPPSSNRPQDKLVEILLVFAKQHFRNPERVCRSSVKFTKKLLWEPLLPHSDPEVDRMALECFQALLCFTGDSPCLTNMEVPLVHSILQMCRESCKQRELQQEVYCQILKQMTYNRSSNRDSSFRCWQLLYIMAAYCPCFDPLLSTVQQYLKTVVRCGSNTLVVLARACYQQMRRSSSIGGRIYYPSPMEIKALQVGKGLRWIFVNLPGAQRQSLKVHMGTTVGDVTQKLCERLGVTQKEHMEEYGITWGESSERLQSPMRSSLYILDLLQDLEKQKTTTASLWFYRTSWAEALVLENKLSVDMQYQQVLRLYETGQLLMRREHEPISQAELASRLAALKHRASGACHPPNRCELRDSIPTDMWSAYDEDYWTRKVLLYFNQLLEKGCSATQAKKMFLDIASSFPLFGTTLLLLANTQPPEARMQPRETKTCTTGMDGQANWACLPEAVLIHIYSLLHLPDKYCMSLSCKAWSRVFRSPAMWQNVLVRVEGGSIRPWIMMLSHYGNFIESVRILLNGENSKKIVSIIEHLAHLRRSKLQSLALVGEDPGSYFNALQESLQILFDVGPATSVGFTEVDFRQLSGRLEDRALISLAMNNPSLEKLQIANKQPSIQLQPRSLRKILDSCRRLSHLSVWSSSLSEDAVQGFLQEHRAPLQLLEIHYGGSTTGFISNHLWKKLKEKFPNLMVRLCFTKDMDVDSILDILQPDTSVVSLDICSRSGLDLVFSYVAQHYHRTIKSLIVRGLETPEMARAVLVLQKSCRQLQQITYHSTT
ncbi:unconventional myosin-XV-like isoform X2 [Pleurodeles waltl]